MPADWKDLLAAATGYTPEEVPTNADNTATEDAGMPVQKKIRIQLDKKQRAGKVVTIIYDIEADDAAVKELAKELKAKCGVGGSVRPGEILMQGDVANKCLEIFNAKGWKARII